MPAGFCKCVWCKRSFRGRKDSMYCSQKCRGKLRAENAKFITPKIPQSGVPGVTCKRITLKWEARYKGKYVGSFNNKEAAIKFLREVQNETTQENTNEVESYCSI